MQKDEYKNDYDYFVQFVSETTCLMLMDCGWYDYGNRH
jgi:hypothetical protein